MKILDIIMYVKHLVDIENSPILGCFKNFYSLLYHQIFKFFPLCKQARKMTIFSFEEKLGSKLMG